MRAVIPIYPGQREVSRLRKSRHTTQGLRSLGILAYQLDSVHDVAVGGDKIVVLGSLVTNLADRYGGAEADETRYRQADHCFNQCKACLVFVV